MSRFYDVTLNGGVNYIRCAPGGCGPLGTGAYTTISLIRIPLFVGATGVIALRRSSAYARYNLVTGNKFFGWQDFSSGFGSAPANQWFWLVQRKNAGAAHYEFAYANYPVVDPDTDIVFGEAPDAGNHGDPVAIDEVWLGETDVHGRGDHALEAAFASRLTNVAIKAALTTALTDIMAFSPVGCWPLNQATALVPVEDVTGNGADEIETVGTVGISDNPPGYDFNITPPPEQAIQIRVGRPGTRWRTGQPAERWRTGQPDPKWKTGAPHA